MFSALDDAEKKIVIDAMQEKNFKYFFGNFFGVKNLGLVTGS